ncbi:ankyrin repeat domain-containing protein 26-like [Bombina bombina]|uniref:ankyrin repeat domain-containing protein 26-like n=1 Tax=Bombina bombina TaxID=8345 RepID=UPI00235B17C5|nr:ankyrin repeat domain-containing protein 26-like [Bombina bombina]
MKKIFSFARKKSKGLSPSTSETGSVLSVGYELKDKDLSKLHRAAASGDVSKIKQLLRKQDINQLDKENRTPLHLACANGHPDAVSVLVESKSKLNLCDNDCRSALMKAVQCQQELCATILLQHEADPNLVDVNGNSALHFAAQIPSIQIATELLEHGGNINAGNRDKCTPLILAVSENHQDMVEFLIKEGADVNAKDVNSRTSLMIASSNGYISLVRLFLQHGADVSLKDKDGWTADDHAVMNGHHACSHLIIEHSARKQPSTSPPFYGTSKARGASSISSPERIVEGGFVLGGPAKDKEVTEDISQAESVSRASGKSADVDSWPSDEDDLDFFPQTPPKPSLKQLLNTKENVNEKGRVTTAQPIAFALQNKDSDEDSLNGSEKEDAIKFPLPKPLSQVRAYPQPGYFKPGSFTELPQMNSSPILSLNKEEDTYSESDGKNSDSEEGSSDREDLPRPSFKAHYKSEEKLQNLETPNDRKVELMSELGLEDDDIESPWDSESASESPRKQSASPSPLSAVPSHMQCISEVSNEDSSEKSTSLEIKQPLKLFPEGKVVLPVAKGDVMADLGLDDADDIEEPTDWDSSSHSKSITHNNSTTSISLQKLNKEQTGSKTGSKEKLTATTTLYTVPEPEIENHMHSGKTGSELNASKKVLQQLHDLGDDISNRNMLNNADCKTENGHMLKETSVKFISEPRNHNVVVSQPSVQPESTLPVLENGQDSSSDSESPWEDRYEKMWVENDKKEVKTHFKDVTAELKVKFGEINEGKKKSPTKNLPNNSNIICTAEMENASSDEKENKTVHSSFVEIPPMGQKSSSTEPQFSLAYDKGCQSSSSLQLRNDIVDPKENITIVAETGKKKDFNVSLKVKDSIFKPIHHNFKHNSAQLQLKSNLANSLSLPSKGLEENMSHTNIEHFGLNSKCVAKDYISVTSENKLKVNEDFLLQTSLEGPGREMSTGEGSKKQLDKELEQDVKRFKNDVGMLQMAFVNLAKDRAQLLKEVDEKQSEKNVHVTGDGDKNSLGMKTDVSELQSKQNNEPKHNSLQGVTGKYINEKEQAENTEDLDDFSQSSDTGTEECELSSSTFRNAMLLIDQLNCEGPDSLNLLKIKNIIHEYEKGIQRENGRYTFLLQKVKKLQSEKKTFQQTFDSNRELKSKLEHHTVEWESELNNLRFTLEQEVEKRRSVELLYDKSKVQLRKKEDQCCKQVEEKQQLELTLRNLDLEMKSLMSSMKQIEEERTETQRLLSQERNARRLQEAALNNLMKKSETEENRKTLTKSTELSNQPSETSEQEKKTAKDTLQQEVSALMLELEQVRSHNQEVETQYTEENIVLKEKIEDLRRDLKMNEETLTQTIIQYNGQLNALKTETAMLYSKLDHEKQNKERLETELDSIRSRLTFTTQELEKNQTLKTEAERSLQRERDEWIRSRDKLNNELSNIHEKNSNLSQQLSKVETKSNSLECDLHKTTLSLQEKTLLLETTQRDLTQASCRINDLEHTLQIEKDQINKSSVKQESLKERFDQSVSENLLLRQQLEELQNKGIVKEKTLSEVQERFSDMYNKLRADTERQVHIVEERNKDLINKSNELREQIYKLETEKVERESALRQLQQELADALKKLSMSEASLEVITRYRNDLEEEKQYLQKELEKHRNKLEGLDEQLSLSQRCNHQFKNMIEDKEREVAAATQKVQELSAAAAGTQNAVKQLEEHVQKLEIENAKFEATIKQQNGQIELLQKELQESLLIRNRMEDLITTLQSSKIDLEEKLNCQVHKQNTLSQNAQDSHNLWEEELKSKSRLGIRLAELSHDKSELADQVESEKRKLKKSLELKRSIEARLDQEMKRNNDLQREVSGLKKLLKAAKKKLKEYDTGIAHQSSNQEVSKNKYLETESEVTKFKEKNKELSLQLDRESLKYRQLESTNRELREEVYSLKNFQKHHNQQEKSSRLLEAEVADLKRQVESNKADQSLMEKYKREIEERARQELCQKLEEVNLFLQRQAASQETLEQIRAESYASLKNQLEHRIQDLELELKMKNTQQETLCQKECFQTELDRYKDLYSEELKARKALTSKLDRANDRLSEVNAKLLNERQRNNSLITSCIVNGTLPANPVLDASQLGNMCGNLTLNRSFGLGDHHLNSSGNGLVASQDESYLVKMQHEMNKNITKELDQAYAELETGSTRVSPVGSTVGSLRNLNTDQDPVSRATQQYLEVLKKNYMI